MKNSPSCFRIAFLAAAHSIHTIRWVNGMAQRGHDVHLLTMHSPNPSNPIDPAVSAHRLPFSPPLGYFLNCWRVRRVLREIKPDLLHTHYASGYGTLSRLADFHPTLLSVWGSDVYDFPYQSSWKQALLRRNLEAADYLASTSHALKAQAGRFVRPGRVIVVTPFGVDCDLFCPGAGARNCEFVVGTVKSLEPGYGIGYLIEAFADAKQRVGKATPLKLVIAGAGSQQEHLQILARRLGLAGETEFLGAVPHAAVPDVLRRFSVYIAPSEAESFGVGVLEASACGIPVVVTNIGGLPEVVVDGVTGFIVPSRTPAAIADAIVELAHNEDLRREMGGAGRAFVLAHYRWSQSLAVMEGLYRQVLQGTLP